MENIKKFRRKLLQSEETSGGNTGGGEVAEGLATRSTGDDNLGGLGRGDGLGSGLGRRDGLSLGARAGVGLGGASGRNDDVAGVARLDNGARAVDDGQGSGLSNGVLLVVELESGRLRAVSGVLGNDTSGGDDGTVLRGNKASGRGDEEESVAGEHLEG
jgi:hypothetical protein